MECATLAHFAGSWGPPCPTLAIGAMAVGMLAASKGVRRKWSAMMGLTTRPAPFAGNMRLGPPVAMGLVPHLVVPVVAPAAVPAVPMATRAEQAAARAGTGTAGFAADATVLMDVVASGVAGMVASNAGMNVERGAGPTCTITTRDGKRFVLSTDLAGAGVEYNSPKHGIHRYKLTRGVWTSTKDGHALLELLARDLVYHCKGYPTF